MAINRIYLLLCCIVSVLVGCDSHSSSTYKAVDKGEFNAGESVYRTVEDGVRHSTNGEEKVQTLRSSSAFSGVTQGSTHKEQIINSVNTIFNGYDVTAPAPQERGSRNPLIKSLFDLIRDGTLPQMTNALGQILQDVSKDEKNIQVITEFLNTRCGIEPRAFVFLVRKVLRYPQSEEFFIAAARLVKRRPELLQSIFQTVSELLSNLPANEETAMLLMLLTQEMPIGADSLGAPAWLTRLDENGNPAVQVDKETMVLYAPFVDKNGDEICDVNEEGMPIDENYQPLDVPAFSRHKYVDEEGNTLIARDETGRGIGPDGNPVFEYYNAKKTVLGFLLYNVGEALERHMLEDSLKISARAFLPTKQYIDGKGSYQGFSDESDCLNAAMGGLELLKKKETLQLIRGFASLIEEKPETAKKFFVGIGKMLVMARDQELKNTQELMQLMFMAIKFGMIPELKQAIDEMADVEVPGSEKSLALFFVDWFGANITDLAENAMWPLRTSMRALKQAYPGDQQLMERWYGNLVAFAIGDFSSGQRKLAPVLPLLLEFLVYQIGQDPENNVNAIKDAIKAIVISRSFAEINACYEDIGNTREAKVVFAALTYYLTPKDDYRDDVYGDLCCMVGLLEFKEELLPKIRLLKMLGSLINPEKPVVMNLIRVLGKVIAEDNARLLLRSLRAAFGECYQYGFAPISMFVHATLAVYRVDYPGQKHNSAVMPEDVRNMLGDFQDILLNPDGMLQRLYRVLGNKH